MKITIEKAIEILTKWEEPETIEESEKLYVARELSIEALKDKRAGRIVLADLSKQLLSGERE